VIITLKPDLRWCSNSFEILCGEPVREDSECHRASLWLRNAQLDAVHDEVR